MATQNLNRGVPQQGSAQSPADVQRTESTSTERQGSSSVARRPSYVPSSVGAAQPTNPFGMMRRMMEDMDQLFQEFGFGRSVFSPHGGGSGTGIERSGGGSAASLWSPQVEVLERDGNLIVRADLPGTKEQDIHVEVLGDNTLVLEGERKYEHEEERGGIWRSERSYGAFRRAIPLPEGVDVENASAHFENGVLEIAMKLPQQTQQQRKRIEVKGRTPQTQGTAQQPPETEQKPRVH